jgi:arsenate reductase
MSPQRVLFACTHNSARSQMAEAMVNAWGGGRFEAHSAGTEATSIRPETFEVMAEIGLDLAGQWSKTTDAFRGQSFDWFITVCDDAHESCPYFPGVPRSIHWSVDDPSGAPGSPQTRLAAFRAARDDLRERVSAFLASS